MAKRKHDEVSQPAHPAPVGSSISTSDIRDSREADSRSESPEPGSSTTILPTRSRPFIASQACDQCRLKKTKCDEDRPKCSTCVRNGLECHYAEAKPTKKDQTISKIYSSIYRLEKKIEDVALLIREQNSTHESIELLPQVVEATTRIAKGQTSRLSIADVLNKSPELTKAQMGMTGDANLFASVPNSGAIPFFVEEAKQMSFSAHKILQWPAIQALLPPQIQGSGLLEDYATKLEASRPPLPFDMTSSARRKPNWLQDLPLSVIRGLTEAYFNTFNTSNPILDKGYFYSSTLGAAVEGGFGYDIETCIVLVVLAIGCLAVKAHQEADFPLFPLTTRGADDLLSDSGAEISGFVAPEWISMVEEPQGLPIGLKFFNEQRTRIGFLMCGTGVQYVQCHLLAALYYGQIVRVLDHWSMINRAAVGCLMLLNGAEAETLNWDTWENDILARVFWNILMFESILVQELEVPPSGLVDYEEVVPLPKFLSYSGSSYVDDNNSNYQYHFLAQAAHRKLLNRMRKNVYTYEPDMSQFPSITLSRELQHQLDLWRSHHPTFIQQDPQNSEVSASPTKLASHALIAQLHGRYLVGRHIMRRPFVYKVLHTPSSEPINPDVLDEVRWCLESSVDWPQTTGIFEKARTAIPIKFGFASQFLGQLLMFKGVEKSEREEVRACLPEGWVRWAESCLQFMRDIKNGSPTLERDIFILEELYKA